ncbi:MAG: CPBP family intramembrane metalloprotease [Clostridium sp.]|nr:CPBP family intramembrane metalloprotease [Clostridium sp.]MCM1547771.1 CPBP family intramembrane metalloprotease [Ruminococcus sp.]
MNELFYEHNASTQNGETKTNAPEIDPQNPFENFTEFREYNSDYREIVPQIDIPGCVIPFEPSKNEKKKIRRYFNITGLGIIIHFLLAQGVFAVLLIILERIAMKVDGIDPSEATSQYMSGLQNFFNSSSINISLNMLVLMTCSILVFLIGSKVTKIKLGSYFQTTGLTFGNIVSYLVISFFIRYVGGFAGVIFEMIFNGVDLSVGTQITSYQAPKTIIVAVVYSCLIAPVTEELMFRGFVLKNLSRVSQRFGIFLSALLFGLMHQNVSQFLFAFVFGIFLAHIDIKHNSLVPSIAVHAFSNSISCIIAYSGILDNLLLSTLTGLGMIVLCVVGIVLYVKFYKANRIPFTMPHQKIRNGTAVSSVMLILSIVLYSVITIVISFPDISDRISLVLEDLS